MNYPTPLLEGVFLRRIQRFLADIQFSDGQIVRAHVPNTGSLLSCLLPGQMARVSCAQDPSRRCPYTLEQLKVGETWVGVNTQRANTLAGEALRAGLWPTLAAYHSWRAEVPYGRQRSRIDWLSTEVGFPDCYVEVKSVTLSQEPGIGGFPDAPSSRARKHLEELEYCIDQGHRAILLYCVQRADVVKVLAAEAIDPAYARALRQAVSRGVEVLALSINPQKNELVIARELPVFTWISYG